MDPPPLSLYIHWPFCAAKCPYCDFNSHVREARDDAAFGAALRREMETWHARLGPRRLRSIFFGGGTPSLMPPALVGDLIDRATQLWPQDDAIEITLEANPTSSEAGSFSELHRAGVNRLSLGVQALDDAALAFLGRKHDVKEALAAIAMAAAIFPRFSFDLIYARKGQTVKAWENELKQALNHAGTHLSLYELTLEPNTAFAARAEQGEVFQATLDEQAEMYEATQAIMNAARLPAYEISNHAAPGAECRHNIAYWNYDEYLGIGPGAHGRLSPFSLHPREGGHEEQRKKLDPRMRGDVHKKTDISDKEADIPAHAGIQVGSFFKRHSQVNTRTPEAWLKKVQAHGHGCEALDPLPLPDMQQEMLLMSLRLTSGIDKALWQQRFHAPLDAFIGQEKKRALINEGLIAESGTHLHATESGRLKLTGITAALAA